MCSFVCVNCKEFQRVSFEGKKKKKRAKYYTRLVSILVFRTAL